uniref:Uncharacterized protein n=1 Tax=Triticum urartu TaxID=4572 RepID=A0A8R7V4Q5_TRIUA
MTAKPRSPLPFHPTAHPIPLLRPPASPPNTAQGGREREREPSSNPRELNLCKFHKLKN